MVSFCCSTAYETESGVFLQPINNITNVGANNVQVNVTAKGDVDGIAEETARKIKDSLLIDEDFQKAFGRKISNKV